MTNLKHLLIKNGSIAYFNVNILTIHNIKTYLLQ